MFSTNEGRIFKYIGVYRSPLEGRQGSLGGDSPISGQVDRPWLVGQDCFCILVGLRFRTSSAIQVTPKRAHTLYLGLGGYYFSVIALWFPKCIIIKHNYYVIRSMLHLLHKPASIEGNSPLRRQQEQTCASCEPGGIPLLAK